MTTTKSAVPASSFNVNDVVKERLKAELAKHLNDRSNISMENIIPEKKEKVVAPPEPIKLGANQVLASTLLGAVLKNDFAVTVGNKDDVMEQVKVFIPDVDPAYQVQVEAASILLRGLEDGDRMLITGPTGSGKSSLMKHLCALTNRPMVRLNMSGDVESANIFGQLTVFDGATVWVDGGATEAVRYGAVLVNDEWDVTPPEIMFGYQWLMEDNGRLFLKEMPGTSEQKMVIPHENFRFVCLGNTLGQGDDSGHFAGTNVQNTATLDRFQTTISLSYLDDAHEKAIISAAVPKLEKDVINKMMKFCRLVRDANATGGINLTMSPRTLINWGKKCVKWDNPVFALQIAFLNKLSEDDKKVVLNMVSKVFGRTE